MQYPNFFAVTLVLAQLLVAAGVTARADAEGATVVPDRTEKTPERLVDVGVDEKLEQRVPTELVFKESDGGEVTLGKWLGKGRPVVVTMNYSGCPMLCSLQLKGFVEALKQLEWTAGQQFEIVTISLDPTETSAVAAETKARYLAKYGRENAAAGWHFLTGSKANVQALASAIGIRYGYNEVRDEYAHPALVTLLTPAGRIARYLYGIEYHPRTLRLSLAEASQGKIGSSIDKLVLYCFHYDETEGHYAPVALNIMRIAGLGAAVALAGLLGMLWWRELRKRRHRLAESTT